MDILGDFIRDINKTAKKFYMPETIVRDMAFMPKPEVISYRDIDYKKYRHVCEGTKPYRDRGCAEFKIMEIVKKHIPHLVNEIFWRRIPTVHEISDFDSRYKRYVGTARFIFTEGA